jgi:hypothetical protein
MEPCRGAGCPAYVSIHTSLALQIEKAINLVRRCQSTRPALHGGSPSLGSYLLIGVTFAPSTANHQNFKLLLDCPKRSPIVQIDDTVPVL